MSEENRPQQRAIRSFVLRQGRLTRAQAHALEHHWQDYGIDYSPQLLNFSGLFDNNNDVFIEIGFGNGESLIAQAEQYPQQNFIGIEVHGPGVGHLIHLAVKAGLDNIRVIRHDAVEVLQAMIADDSVAQFQLFFPDTWHKKRHHKRRIMKPAFIELIRQKLRPGGTFHMATDWQPYAEEMLDQMDSSEGFSNTAGKGHYSPDRGQRFETKFERRGKRLGHGVWDLIYRKK